jgi:KDO2-lipid IV(A) lauroyltransferase
MLPSELSHGMRYRLEYAPAWLVAHILGAMPRPLARAAAILLARLFYLFHGRLRRVGMRNLQIAFSQMEAGERRHIVRELFDGLGRQLAEVCLFPRYTRENAGGVAVYDGFENFERAHNRGKGVIFLTAHLGGWEIGSFVHAVNGHPLKVLIRPLDNPYLDRLVAQYRGMHGNESIPKNDIRAVIAALRAGETVGILMDQNMTPPQGVFVDFFGHAACTTTVVARLALRTDAAVVPGFTIWDRTLGKYRIHFDAAQELVRTGDEEADAVANTAVFTKVIEEYARKYPGQWLWVHRRWKTRPPGEPPLY